MPWPHQEACKQLRWSLGLPCLNVVGGGISYGLCSLRLKSSLGSLCTLTIFFSTLMWLSLTMRPGHLLYRWSLDIERQTYTNLNRLVSQVYSCFFLVNNFLLCMMNALSSWTQNALLHVLCFCLNIMHICTHCWLHLTPSFASLIIHNNACWMLFSYCMFCLLIAGFTSSACSSSACLSCCKDFNCARLHVHLLPSQIYRCSTTCLCWNTPNSLLDGLNYYVSSLAWLY
jgi:hypothetical protein